MNKYFLKFTGEEVKIGDTIALDLEGKDKKSNKLFEHLEVKATPMMLELLIKEGVVEEKDVKKKAQEVDSIKFDIEALKKHFDTDSIKTKLDELDKRLIELEGIVAEWNHE